MTAPDVKQKPKCAVTAWGGPTLADSSGYRPRTAHMQLDFDFIAADDFDADFLLGCRYVELLKGAGARPDGANETLDVDLRRYDRLTFMARVATGFPSTKRQLAFPSTSIHMPFRETKTASMLRTSSPSSTRRKMP